MSEIALWALVAELFFVVALLACVARCIWVRGEQPPSPKKLILEPNAEMVSLFKFLVEQIQLCRDQPAIASALERLIVTLTTPTLEINHPNQPIARPSTFKGVMDDIYRKQIEWRAAREQEAQAPEVGTLEGGDGA